MGGEISKPLTQQFSMSYLDVGVTISTSGGRDWGTTLPQGGKNSQVARNAAIAVRHPFLGHYLKRASPGKFPYGGP